MFLSKMLFLEWHDVTLKMFLFNGNFSVLICPLRGTDVYIFEEEFRINNVELQVIRAPLTKAL